MGVWDQLGDPAHHEALLRHPSHAALARYIADHLVEIRGSSGREGLRRPQESLFWTLIDAERRFQAAQKHFKKTGKDEFEAQFWRSAVAQYRTLGDAIAWRFLACDRQQILLLGRNQHPGLMIGKAGTDDEWAKFNEHWDAGQPTLLTALTRCITATDLIVEIDRDTAKLVEVKRSPKSKDPKQEAALAEVVKTLTVEPCFEEGTRKACFLRSDVPMETHWPDAGEAVAQALTTGVATWVPNPGVSMLLLAPGRTNFGSRKAAEEHVMAMQAEANKLMAPRSHQLLGNSFELPYRMSRTAPLSMFPLPVEQTAMLVSGELLFASTIGLDYFVDALSAEGVLAEIALPDKHGELGLDSVVLRFRTAAGSGFLRSGLAQSLGFELVKPQNWAQAIATAPAPPGAPKVWAAELCMANEAAAWS